MSIWSIQPKPQLWSAYCGNIGTKIQSLNIIVTLVRTAWHSDCISLHYQFASILQNGSQFNNVSAGESLS